MSITTGNAVVIDTRVVKIS